MLPTFTKALMVLLLCLTFIGQVMASTLMPYRMMNMNEVTMQGQSHDMAMMADNAEQMASDSATATNDCCTNDCECLIAGCSTFAALSQTSQTEFNMASASKIHSITTSALSQYLTSLYRPPILS
ncbi:CopL family metal-binding regulatory protein [Colwellia sp. TT2012]|uniref:CopL family metal-binding regulatory protein n=1 Tax=Colwellia sp. TT2012 TaxID=1720342 RepID=UPI00070CCC04|nr:CopL family metal-binding regulatory protein [Colwellia sp. TT2012]